MSKKEADKTHNQIAEEVWVPWDVWIVIFKQVINSVCYLSEVNTYAKLIYVSKYWKEIITSTTELSILRTPYATNDVPFTHPPPRRFDRLCCCFHSRSLAINSEYGIIPLKLIDYSPFTDLTPWNTFACDFYNFGTDLHFNFVNIKLRLEKKMDPDIRDLSGLPILHAALTSNRCKLTELLLNKGADVNIRDETLKQSALHRAAYFGKLECTKILIERGAEINALGSYDGRTPLIGAVIQNRNLIVELLIEAGADIGIKTNAGMTALDFATRHQFYEIEILLRICLGKECEGISKINK